MTMISYAQNREDVLLRRLFPAPAPGFYIDVGASDPTVHSITRHFYEEGWSGINVEPRGDGHERFCAERPRDVNLNVGLSNRPGSLTFYQSVNAAAGELSTFSARQAELLTATGHQRFIERTVAVTTLAELCERHVQHQLIDFMSIDVEGHERQVLEGGDWKRWRPRVLLIESIQAGTSNLSHELWEDILLGADYVYAAFDGINRYYLRAEDRAFLPHFSVPVNFLDNYMPYEPSKAVLLQRVCQLEKELEHWQGHFALADGTVKRLMRDVDSPKMLLRWFWRWLLQPWLPTRVAGWFRRGQPTANLTHGTTLPPNPLESEQRKSAA